MRACAPEDVQAVVQRAIQGDEASTLRLKDFRETEAEQVWWLGIPEYHIEFAASAEVTRDVAVSAGNDHLSVQRVRFSWRAEPETAWAEWAASGRPTFAGDQLRIHG